MSATSDLYGRTAGTDGGGNPPAIACNHGASASCGLLVSTGWHGLGVPVL